MKFADIFAAVEDALTFGGGRAVVTVPPCEAGYNGMGELRIGNVLVRITRDRGQDFMDVAPASEPAVYAYFEDVAVAMGWAAPEEVYARTDPRKVLEEAGVLSANVAVLQEAFGPEHVAGTLRRIENAGAARGEAFAEGLRRAAKKS